MSFGGSPTPRVEPTPPVPEKNDPALEEARRKELETDRKAKGRAATLLTGGAGATGVASIAKPTLLGSRG
jgi:hypothetical protein